MPTLRADENRYLLQAEPWERARVRRIPGARWVPARQMWQLPLRDGVILALDRVFGRDGWEAGDDTTRLDVEAARHRQVPQAREPATVRLDGTELAVTCDIGDRELVKLVPGYRWAPANRTWYVPGVPLALEILREYFGDLLQVDEEAARTMELRELDEQRAIERDQKQFERRQEELRQRAESPPAADPAPLAPGEVLEAAQEVVRHAQQEVAAPDTADDPVVERLDRIDATLQRLEALFTRVADALASAGPAPVTAAPPPPPAAEAEDSDSSPDDDLADWRAILAQSQEDPEAALDQASRLLQITSGPSQRELRAVAGVAAHRARHEQQAYEHLSQAFRDGPSLHETLARPALDTFRDVVLWFLNDAVGPAEPIEDVRDLRRLILAELQTDAGFRDELIGSPGARDTLERFVKDPALPLLFRDLADFCRVAHLVAVAHGGGRMVMGHIADVLRDERLHPDAQALATILYTNVLFDEPSMAEWAPGWPREPNREHLREPRLIVDGALRILPVLEADLAAPTAVAALACAVQSDEVGLDERRALVNFVPRSSSLRRYAEFLALYALAASGGRGPWQQMPGYVEIVAQTRLELSRQHLEEVYIASEPGDTNSAVRPLADLAYLPALKTFGVTDPESEVIGLLDFLASSSRPDNLLNELGRLIEDREFPGAERFRPEQRMQVYRAALDAAIGMGHDQDAREAFHRLVRALQDEPSSHALRELCAECLERFRRLRVPALIVLIEALLEDGADVTESMQMLSAMVRGQGEDAKDAEAQLQGLQFAYPEFAEQVRKALEERGEPIEEVEPPSFEGRSVTVVGGREYMRKRAFPVLEAWGLKVTWLDPQAAQNRAQAKALAASSDLLVVNTACIGHAASNRVIEAARDAGKDPLRQDSNGVGTMLLAVQRRLSEMAEEEQPQKRRRRIDDLRRRAGL